MNYQQTIAKSISINGIGLHTGKKCKAEFHPAPDNFGIQFVRVDLPGKPVFPVQLNMVADVIRGTTLGMNGDRVYTIEHILSALNGLGVDNLLIELNENEPPVMDGSALPFARTILEAGLVKQTSLRNPLSVSNPIEYTSNQTKIRLEPFDGFEIVCEVDYNHPMIRSQIFTFNVETMSYLELIAPARTFCFDYEIEALKKKGLAKGGSLDNAIVIGAQGIYNPGKGLRFPDEFVRHKILDLMGDLKLFGRPLRGRVIANRCGHGHNVKFIAQVLSMIAEHKTSTPV